MSSLVLSGGLDGKACIYDINRKVMVNHVQYSSSVTSIRWLPLDVITNYSKGSLFVHSFILLFLDGSNREPSNFGLRRRRNQIIRIGV